MKSFELGMGNRPRRMGNVTSHEYEAQNRVFKITAADPNGVGDLTSPITSRTGARKSVRAFLDRIRCPCSSGSMFRRRIRELTPERLGLLGATHGPE